MEYIASLSYGKDSIIIPELCKLHGLPLDRALIDGEYSNLNGFELLALGKTVFLTKEDAEKALEERNAQNG